VVFLHLLKKMQKSLLGLAKVASFVAVHYSLTIPAFDDIPTV